MNQYYSVDGKHPAPVGRWFIVLSHYHELVQDSAHPQYDLLPTNHESLTESIAGDYLSLHLYKRYFQS